MSSLIYKTDNTPNHFSSSEDEVSDPPVEKSPEVFFDYDHLRNSILYAKEYYEKNDDYNLLKNFDFWEKSINTLYKKIPKSLFRETDFCDLLKKIASNGDKQELQYHSIVIIAKLMDISNDSIDEFVDSSGMDFFIWISHSPNPKIKNLGYQILNFSLKTPKGLAAFIDKKVIDELVDSFKVFLSLPSLPQDEGLQKFVNIIGLIFQNFVSHIADKEIDPFPKEAPKKILEAFISSLKANYNYDEFFHRTLDSATIIVYYMKNEGNEIILKTGFLDSIINDRNLGSHENIFLIITLLKIIFSQTDEAIKLQLFKKVPQQLFISQFLLTKIDSDLFISITNTICNCFMCGMEYTWILMPEYLSKFQEIFETGNYESKLAASKCLMMAAYFSTADFCSKLINSKILIPSIQFISSMNSINEIKTILKIMNKMLEKIVRLGINSSLIDEEIIDVLKTLGIDPDESIACLIEYIFKYYYPEIYFDEN